MPTGSTRFLSLATALVFVGVVSPPASASDPPHDPLTCDACHDAHTSARGTLLTGETVANTCMGCHNSSGTASAYAFADGDQALPGTSGTSHRFDSGASGHVEASTGNTSTGAVTSTGTYTGRTERAYTITITTAGQTGTARYGWTSTEGTSGSNVPTASTVTLEEGLSLQFADGSTSPSFVLNDTWTLYVLSDLRQPVTTVAAEKPMAQRLESGKVTCSTCHNQHSQAKAPADPLAPAYGGAGTGEGRHLMRVTNSANEMCVVCHSARNVTAASGGSHPVGVAIPASSTYTTPASLTLWSGEVKCTTCHDVHDAATSDGYVLEAPMGTLCAECHALDGTGSGVHASATSGVLWPGGQYGSTFEARSSGERGSCVNCHWPHGWPDDASTTADYGMLWVERYDTSDTGADPDDAEDLCYTCHDGSPVTENVLTEMTRGTNGDYVYHHPVKDSEQTSSTRSVECVDCHNPHMATASEPWAGAGGTTLAGAAIEVGSTTQEYETCLSCHGSGYNSSRGTIGGNVYWHPADKSKEFATTASSYHPVQQAGRNTSTTMVNNLVAPWTVSSTMKCSDCHSTTNTTGPKGPHGSTIRSILKAEYVVGYKDVGTPARPTRWSASNFALCFTCHSQTRIYSDASNYTNFTRHQKHLSKGISCRNCHWEPHGTDGCTTTSWVIKTSASPAVEYTSSSLPAGKKTRGVCFSPDATKTTYSKPAWYMDTTTNAYRCYLTCHGENHAGESYSPSSVYNNDAKTF